MKKNLLLVVLAIFPILSFSQTFPLHDVDGCKVLPGGFANRAVYNVSVPNPDNSVYSATNVSSFTYDATVAPGPSVSRVFYDLPEKIQAGTTFDFNGRFYSANAGNAAGGSGQFRIQLQDIETGTFLSLTPYDKTGGAWQQVTETGISTSINPSTDSSIISNGGFDRIIITGIVNTNTATIFEDFFFDDLQLSIESYPPLSDLDANLLAGNNWVYNNRPGDNKNVFGGANPFGEFNTIVTADVATPSTAGNSASEVIEVELESGFSAFRLPISPIDPPFTGTVNYRIYNSTCTLDYSDFTAITIRKDFNNATQFVSSNVIFNETNQWVEISFDLSTLSGTASGETGYNQLLISFGSDANSIGSVYYLDAIQTPNGTSTTYTYNGTTWNIDPTGVSTAADDIEVVSGTVSLSGNIKCQNLTVNSGATLEFDSTSIIDIAGDITNNGDIVFKSTSGDSAQLDEFNGSITGAGEITTERHIPAKRAFRFLSSPVGGQSFANSWQLDTHITGVGGATNGFDATSTNSPSLFTFNNSANPQSGGNSVWEAVTNTISTNIIAGTPYRLFVRGDRSINLGINNPTATPTTLSATGTLHTGSFSPTLATVGENYSFVGNPYQSVVDISATDRINLTNFIYVWDTTIGGANGNGGFVTVTISSGTNNSPTAPSPNSSDASEYIAPGQAFFVQNTTSGNGSITFEESDKETDVSEVTVFSTYPNFYINSRIYRSDAYQNNDMESDAIGLRFSDSFTTLGSDEDAGKLANAGENYAIINNGFKSIDNQGIPIDDHEIELFMSNYQDSEYILTFNLGNKPENLSVFLNDNYLNTATELTTNSIYNFTVDQNLPESTSATRFSLIFNPTTLNNIDFTENNIKIYPNPTKGNIFINLSDESVLENITLFNLLGEKIMQSQRQQLNINHLASGVYLLKIKTSNGQLTRKIVKQ